MARLLLVDDDPYLLQALRKLFQSDGHFCAVASSAAQARSALLRADAKPFDLLLLDVGLPDGDGFSLCRQIRTRQHLPILMLTARCAPTDKVIGLELGADDYITKPFDPAELLARVRSCLRRATEYSQPPEQTHAYQVGSLCLNADARVVTVESRSVVLTEREFELLHLFVRYAGKALASDWIFESVWGCDATFGLKTLTVHVQRLRAKIEPDPHNPRHLMTVRGFGYKLCP